MYAKTVRLQYGLMKKNKAYALFCVLQVSIYVEFGNCLRGVRPS